MREVMGFLRSMGGRLQRAILDIRRDGLTAKEAVRIARRGSTLWFRVSHRCFRRVRWWCRGAGWPRRCHARGSPHPRSGCGRGSNVCAAGGWSTSCQACRTTPERTAPTGADRKGRIASCHRSAIPTGLIPRVGVCCGFISRRCGRGSVAGFRSVRGIGGADRGGRCARRSAAVPVAKTTWESLRPSRLVVHGPALSEDGDTELLDEVMARRVGVGGWCSCGRLSRPMTWCTGGASGSGGAGGGGAG